MAGHKHLDFLGTYTKQIYANVRYVSSAKESIDGWAYIFTKDSGYVEDLAYNRRVEVKMDGEWVPFSGEFVEPEDFPGEECSNSTRWQSEDDE
jgi:hypothetical protein